MSEPFIGELRLIGFTYAPRGWSFANGSLLPINQYSALFALLGTNYGGNGVTTFGLPDLRGRVPIGATNTPAPGLGNYSLGQTAGTENTTLTQLNLPAHIHPFAVPVTNNEATVKNPVNNASAVTPSAAYAPATGQSGATGTTGPSGSNQPFSILQPYQVLNWIIALEGIFPSRN